MALVVSLTVFILWCGGVVDAQRTPIGCGAPVNGVRIESEQGGGESESAVIYELNINDTDNTLVRVSTCFPVTEFATALNLFYNAANPVSIVQTGEPSHLGNNTCEFELGAYFTAIVGGGRTYYVSVDWDDTANYTGFSNTFGKFRLSVQCSRAPTQTTAPSHVEEELQAEDYSVYGDGTDSPTLETDFVGDFFGVKLVHKSGCLACASYTGSCSSHFGCSDEQPEQLMIGFELSSIGANHAVHAVNIPGRVDQGESGGITNRLFYAQEGVYANADAIILTFEQRVLIDPETIANGTKPTFRLFYLPRELFQRPGAPAENRGVSVMDVYFLRGLPSPAPTPSPEPDGPDGTSQPVSPTPNPTDNALVDDGSGEPQSGGGLSSLFDRAQELLLSVPLNAALFIIFAFITLFSFTLFVVSWSMDKHVKNKERKKSKTTMPPNRVARGVSTFSISGLSERHIDTQFASMKHRFSKASVFASTNRLSVDSGYGSPRGRGLSGGGGRSASVASPSAESPRKKMDTLHVRSTSAPSAGHVRSTSAPSAGSPRKSMDTLHEDFVSAEGQQLTPELLAKHDASHTAASDDLEPGACGANSMQLRISAQGEPGELEDMGTGTKTDDEHLNALPPMHMKLFLTGIALIDFVSDCLFVVERVDSPDFVIGWIAASFMLVTLLTNVTLIFFIMRHEFRLPQVRRWFNNNHKLAVLTFLLSCSNIDTIALLYSRVFRSKKPGSRFYAPFSAKTREQLYSYGIVGNFVEDIPLLTLQLISLFMNGASFVLVVAVITSMLALLFGIFRRVCYVILFREGTIDELEKVEVFSSMTAMGKTVDLSVTPTDGVRSKSTSKPKSPVSLATPRTGGPGSVSSICSDETSSSCTESAFDVEKPGKTGVVLGMRSSTDEGVMSSLSAVDVVTYEDARQVVDSMEFQNGNLTRGGPGSAMQRQDTVESFQSGSAMQRQDTVESFRRSKRGVLHLGSLNFPQSESRLRESPDSSPESAPPTRPRKTPFDGDAIIEMCEKENQMSDAEDPIVEARKVSAETEVEGHDPAERDVSHTDDSRTADQSSSSALSHTSLLNGKPSSDGNTHHNRSLSARVFGGRQSRRLYAALQRHSSATPSVNTDTTASDHGGDDNVNGGDDSDKNTSSNVAHTLPEQAQQFAVTVELAEDHVDDSDSDDDSAMCVDSSSDEEDVTAMDST